MSKGKILRVRMGHEANCSSGMYAAYFILIVGRAAFLLVALLSLVVQAANLRNPALDDRRRFRYWATPQVIGLILSAILILFVFFVDSIGLWSLWMVLLVLSIPFALSITVGYVLLPRIKYPILSVLIALLVFGAGTMVSPLVLEAMIELW
jgi:hypothetical protein